MTRTPGPWRYEAATKTIRSVPANYWLATMDSFDGAVDHEANARLIAAAPDLLEACRMFCDTMAFSPSSVPGAIEHDLKIAYDHAVAAIAKAEGRQ
jgi:hypothetical protein